MMQSETASSPAPSPVSSPTQSPFATAPTTPTTAVDERNGTSSSPLLSPRIAINGARPTLAPHISAPAATQYPSPMRHHKRTPSQHREIKETLNAVTEYTSDENEGTHHRINQYILKDEIGRGSYGAVHLAVDQYGHEFAIKEFSKTRLRKRAQSNILKRPHGARPNFFAPGQGQWAAHKRQLSRQEAEEAKDALYLIREEVAIMKKLNHPNLVSLIEVLDDPEEDSLYMVLEMCKKGVVMKVGLGDTADPYDEESCRCWFRDLILGIEYLHSQGVVHRDIKPDNLLLTSDDVLKIVDFGVSEMFEKPQEMVTKKSMGSPAFLPPELCVSKHGDVSGKAADIWSMGISLYCLKYGRLPFQRDTVPEMLDAIRTEQVPVPPDENPDLVDLFSRILDKNPDTRITMAELRNHPWVTKGGIDPLLSEEENCTEVIEAPNELEVNHAFTRKMTHLLCVMKAIQKFRNLTCKSRAGTPTRRSFPVSLSPEYLTKLSNLDNSPMSAAQPRSIPDPTNTKAATTENTSTKNTDSSSSPSTNQQKSTAEEAAKLVEQRKAFMASLADHPSDPNATSTPVLGVAGGDKGHAQDPTDKPPLLLGIGTGGQDDFLPSRKSSVASTTSAAAAAAAAASAAGAAAQDEPEEDAYVVSDSPTGIDFDIYDHAFEAEMKRIRSQKTTRGGRGARTYLTRLVGEHERLKYAGDECMVFSDLAADAVGAARARIEDRRNRRRESGGDDGESTEGGGQGQGHASAGAVKDVVGRAANVATTAVAGSSRFADLVTQMTKGRAAESGST